MKGSSPCHKIGIMFLCIAFCLMLVGCGGSRITTDNVAKLKVGTTTEKEATEIFGTPTESKEQDATGGGKEKVVTWKSGDSHVKLTFDKEGKLRGQDVKISK